MKRGEPVPEKYVISLIELMRANVSLGDYLRPEGHDELPPTQEILDLVAGPARPPVDPHAAANDWLLKGVAGLVDIFTNFLMGELVRPGTLCRTEADVRTATRMILASAGRDSAGDRGLPDEEAIARAEDHMKVDRQTYEARLMAHWRSAPWCLAFAVVDRRRVGCTLTLPLTEAAYDAIRSGQRSLHTCESSDLTVPSSHLFIEACAERADADYPHSSKRSLQLFRMLYVQAAALSATIDEGPHPCVRILCMAGSPKNRARLVKFGHRPTGTKMHGFDIELMELDERLGLYTYLTLGHLRKRLRQMPLSLTGPG